MSLFEKQGSRTSTAHLNDEAQADDYMRKLRARYRAQYPGKRISFRCAPDGEGGCRVEVKYWHNLFEVDAAFESAVRSDVANITPKREPR